MALNTNFMIAPSLQEYFVDKITGLPLSGGLVYFFSDTNRSTPKPIYTLSGSPPNYSYVQLPNPSTLSGVGTFQDALNNDILPYYYPFDINGNVELYFIEVFDSNGVLQFTREAWPNIAQEIPVAEETDVTNFIPNGQFLIHNNIPANKVTNSQQGIITLPSTQIAPGGWTFERPSVTTAVDYIFFFRYTNYITDPTSSPRYAVNIECAGANPSDNYKALRVKFADVNKFASSTQEYTFAFNAITNSGGPNFAVALNLVKNFGVGGSPQTITQLTTFNITSTQTLFQFSFIFGQNIGQNIGANDDDFVALDISFPTNLTFNALFTDFQLVLDNVVVSTFPISTNNDFIDRSVLPPAPDPNGFDLYLPLVQTKYGLDYDSSQVGKIYITSSATAGVGELLCDGTTYRSDNYSVEGIPYRRLQSRLIGHQSATFPISPLFGTGSIYVTAFPFVGASTFITLTTNIAGAQSAVTDGANPTGFTFSVICNGQPNLGFMSVIYGDETSIWILNNSPGVVVFPIGPGTSGFSVNTIANPNIGERIGSPNCQQLISVRATTIPSAGTYFFISTTVSQYYVWFTIDGVGSDPAPGGTGVKVALLSTMALQDVMYCIVLALNGYQSSTIEFSAGSVITPNSYFTFGANGTQYYAWYSLNGSGADPLVPGAIGIPIYYTTSYTATNVANNTLYMINDLYFAVPDLRGVYIKGWDPTGSIDLNSIYRYDNNTENLPHYIGSRSFSTVLNHTHSLETYLLNTGVIKQVSTMTATTPTGIQYASINTSGVFQTDVENIYLNYVIKI